MCMIVLANFAVQSQRQYPFNKIKERRNGSFYNKEIVHSEIHSKSIPAGTSRSYGISIDKRPSSQTGGGLRWDVEVEVRRNNK